MIPTTAIQRKSSAPPSKIPPYHRPIVQLERETLTAAGTVSKEVCYLNATSGGPFDVVLENGTFERQWCQVFILGENARKGISADFYLVGNFAGGFNAAHLSNTGTSLTVEWDGSTWQFLGGNAELIKNYIGGGVAPPDVEKPAFRVHNGVLQFLADDGFYYTLALHNAGGTIAVGADGSGEE